MIKFLRLALRRLAAAAVRALPRRWRRDKKSAAPASPVAISPEIGEKQTVEPSGKVEIPAAQADVGPQANPVVVPEGARDSTSLTPSELQPVVTVSVDTGSEQPVETPPADLQADTPTVTESLVSQAEQPAAPQIVVPTESDVRVESSSVSALTKTGKKEEKRRIAPEHRGGGKMETEEGSKTVEQPERTRLAAHLRLVCFKDNYRMWQLAVELPEEVSAEVIIEML